MWVHQCMRDYMDSSNKFQHSFVIKFVFISLFWTVLHSWIKAKIEISQTKINLLYTEQSRHVVDILQKLLPELEFQGRSHASEYDVQQSAGITYDDLESENVTTYDEHRRSGEPVIGNPIGNIQAANESDVDDDTPLLCAPKQLLPYWPYTLGILEIVFGFLATGFGKVPFCNVTKRGHKVKALFICLSMCLSICSLGKLDGLLLHNL